LAAEYGWTKDYILENVYPDEAHEFLNAIKKRTYGRYLMELAIAQNTTTKEPRKLWDMLEKESGENEIIEEEIDHAGIQKLKSMIKR